MRIALVQMNVEYGKTEQNLVHAEEMIREAVKGSPDVIVLPEMWNTSYALKKIKDIADKDGKPSAQVMGNLAKDNNTNIIAGSVADNRAGKIYNTSYVFDRQGKNTASYSKVHLFGLMHEGEYMTAGNERVSFSLDNIDCGLIICYDLRFPELSRSLALDGAKILFIPAQWPNPRMHPWRTLIQARAIENQMFVVAVNRVGKEGKAEFFGHSMIVDPLGQIILEGSEKEEILFMDIDLGQVDNVRNHMTCFADRVPEAYI